MADDIDDLLDEVESKYFSDQTRRKPKTQNKSKELPAEPASTSSIRKLDEIDALIDDIGSVPEPLGRVLPDTQNIQAVAGQKRCFPVYLGGSRIAKGSATGALQRACDKLRCLECDFRVSHFDDFEWLQDTDYLFLRNNMPDFDRLKVQLHPSGGARAYACQCKWKNVSTLVDIQNEKQMKWVCGQH